LPTSSPSKASVDDAIRAAVLLGRWTRIVERHGGGCSCCPGLGDVAIDEVEKRVTDWLRLERPFTAVLRECIERRSALSADLQKNVDEALAELERIQSGMP
jgi:hypothetical protein